MFKAVVVFSLGPDYYIVVLRSPASASPGKCTVLGPCPRSTKFTSAF